MLRIFWPLSDLRAQAWNASATHRHPHDPRAVPEARVTYRAVGSSTGQLELLTGGAIFRRAGEENPLGAFTAYSDFGSGDIPIPQEDYDAVTATGRTVLHFPVCLLAAHRDPGPSTWTQGRALTSGEYFCATLVSSRSDEHLSQCRGPPNQRPAGTEHDGLPVGEGEPLSARSSTFCQEQHVLPGAARTASLFADVLLVDLQSRHYDLGRRRDPRHQSGSCADHPCWSGDPGVPEEPGIQHHRGSHDLPPRPLPGRMALGSGRRPHRVG
eukprot:scaffold1390_cov249-Pinguiococcus_pyrenoidosus.AAC.7